jgi:hypothetical protein
VEWTEHIITSGIRIVYRKVDNASLSDDVTNQESEENFQKTIILEGLVET